jgi:hypothetical protein
VVGDFTWEPNRYMFNPVLVEDKSSRCYYSEDQYLCLHKFENQNIYGETEKEVKQERSRILNYFEQQMIRVGCYHNAN